MANAEQIKYYTCKQIFYGDSFPALDVTYSIIGATRNLVGATIQMIIKDRIGSDITRETLSSTGTSPVITIPNTANLRFIVAGRAMVGYENNNHEYVGLITVTYSDGAVKTCFQITIPILRK